MEGAWRGPVTWDLLLWVLTILGLLAFSTAIAAIVLAVRFRGHVRASRVWDRSAFLPKVLVLVPCRGAEPGLEVNLDAILSQAYSEYRVLFCVDRLDDPSVPVIARARARHEVPSEVAEAADLPGFSGKATALLGGLRGREPSDEVVAFVDSDIRPDPGFLRALVQPLALPSIGGWRPLTVHLESPVNGRRITGPRQRIINHPIGDAIGFTYEPTRLSDGTVRGRVPNVVGLSPTDALNVLHAQGFEPRADGEGRQVAHQDPDGDTLSGGSNRGVRINLGP